MSAHRLNLYRIALLALFLGLPFSAHAVDISWNGFGSTYYGQPLSRGLRPAGFTDKHANFTNFSLVGLNLRALVNDDLAFAAQFVALGNPVGSTDSFGLMAQWAFVNYRPTESTSLRMGRQLYPTLLASEYARVGFLLPFRQVPYGVFGTAPFTRFDGFSATQAFEVGFGKLTIGVFGGKPQLDIVVAAASGLIFNFADLIGAQATVDGDGWRIHAQASRFFSELTQGTPLPAGYQSGHTQGYSVGYRFDKYRLVSWSEFTLAQTPDGTPVNGGRYVGVGHGFYWLGGYRLGKFMPRYTFAQASNDFNILGATGYNNGKSTTHTVGLNYLAGNQAVIKIEYERVLIPRAQEGSYFVVQPADSTETSAGAFYAGLDFIF